MAVVSLLSRTEFDPNDYREDAYNFTYPVATKMTFGPETTSMSSFYDQNGLF